MQTIITGINYSKMIALTKMSKAIYKNTDDYKPVLQYVRIDGKTGHAEATDGYRIMSVNRLIDCPETLEKMGQAGVEAIYIPMKELKRITKVNKSCLFELTIPDKAGARPFISYFNGKNDDNVVIGCQLNELDHGGKYPDLSEVTRHLPTTIDPQPDEEKQRIHSISFNPVLLGDFATVADTICLVFGENKLSPVAVFGKGNTVTEWERVGVIMPIRSHN